MIFIDSMVVSDPSQIRLEARRCTSGGFRSSNRPAAVTIQAPNSAAIRLCFILSDGGEAGARWWSNPLRNYAFGVGYKARSGQGSLAQGLPWDARINAFCPEAEGVSEMEACRWSSGSRFLHSSLPLRCASINCYAGLIFPSPGAPSASPTRRTGCYSWNAHSCAL
jgi:hypothetical protein